MPIDAFVLSQILAGLAVFAHASSFQFRARRKTLLFIMVAMALLSAHFYLLDALTAAAITALNVLRYATGIVTTNQKVMGVFLALILILGFITYESPVDLLPIFAGSMGTIAVFRTDPQIMRRFMFGGTVSMLVHNSLIFSPVAILFELLIGTSNAISYWRFYRTKEKLTQ